MMHIRQHLLAAQPRTLTANTVTVPAAAQWEVPRVDRGPGSRGCMRTSSNSRAGAESGRSTHTACPEMIYTLQPLPGADVPGSVTSGTTENLQTRTRIEPTGGNFFISRSILFSRGDIGSNHGDWCCTWYRIKTLLNGRIPVYTDWR